MGFRFGLRPPKTIRPAEFVRYEETYHGKITKTYGQPEVEPGRTASIYVDILNDGMDAAHYLLRWTVYGKTGAKLVPTVNPGDVKRDQITFTMEKDATVKIELVSEVG